MKRLLLVTYHNVKNMPIHPIYLEGLESKYPSECNGDYGIGNSTLGENDFAVTLINRKTGETSFIPLSRHRDIVKNYFFDCLSENTSILCEPESANKIKSLVENYLIEVNIEPCLQELRIPIN